MLHALSKEGYHLADAPGQNEPHAQSPQNDPEQHGESTPGQSALPYGGTNNRTNETNEGRRDGRPWWIRMWVWKPWKRVLTIIVGIGGIAYAFVTYFQWRDLKHNFEVEQRAWVTMQFGFPADPTQPFGAKIINTGKSAALHSIADFSFQIVDSKNAPSFDPKDRHFRDTLSVLFPGGSPDTFRIGPLSSDSGPRMLSTAEVQDLRDGKTYVALSGLIVYSDQFGQHWTRFCFWKDYAFKWSTFESKDCVLYGAVGDGDPPN